MTTETFTPASPYTISGTGPYAIPFEYSDQLDIKAEVVDGDTVTLLTTSSYTIAPTSYAASGNLTLTSGAAATHAGKTLCITRATRLEQGWVGNQTSREKGLERQVDLNTRHGQDIEKFLRRVPRLPVTASLTDPVLPVPSGPLAIMTTRADLKGWQEGPLIDDVLDYALPTGDRRLECDTFSQLATLFNYTGTGGRRLAVPGNYIWVKAVNALFLVLVFGASTFDINYTGTGGIKLLAVPQLKGVTPEQLGAAGNATGDDAAAINLADLVAARSGKRLVLRGQYLVGSQLLQSSGVTWDFQGGEIIRNWTSKNTDKQANATIRNRNAPTLAAFYVDPGPFVPTGVDSGCRLIGDGTIRMSTTARSYADTNDETAVGGPARMTQLWWVCHDAYIGPGIKFQSGGRDWCITVWGDNFMGDSFEIYGGNYIYEDGFHVIGGKNGRLFSPKIESGDDSIAFATNFNQAISDWVVVAPSVFSARAFGLKFANYRTGSTSSYGPTTERIKNILVIAPTWRGDGRASRNGYFRCDTGSEDPDLVRNCRVIEADMQGEDNGLPVDEATGTAAVSYDGSEDCGFQGVIRHPSQWAVLVDGAINADTNVISLDPQNWTATGGGIRAVDVRGAASGTKLNGTVAGGALSGALTMGADVESEHLELINTATGINAITMSNDTTLTVRGRLSVKKAAAATTTRAVSPGTGCELIARDLDYDVERFANTPAAFSRLILEYDPEHRTTVTVSSGAFTSFADGAISVLCEGGVTDTLATIAGGYDGQELTLYNGQSAPGTAVLSVVAGGNIAVRTPVVLDTAAKFLRLRYDAATAFWTEIVPRRLSGSATYDPPSIAAGAFTTTTVTVTGAALGDDVTVTFSLTLAGLIMFASVSAADTVTVTFWNPTGSAIDRGSGTLRAVVTK